MIAVTENQSEAKRFDEFLIAEVLFGATKFPHFIPSPLREDTNPSCDLYVSNGRVRFKDFSTNENYTLTDLLLLIYHCSYKELGPILEKELNKERQVVNTQRVKVYQSIDYKLDYEEREWNDDDISYWSSYGVTIDCLKKCNVHPISKIIYDYPKVRKIIKADPLAYVFLEGKDGIITKKIYQPKSDSKNKWRNDHNSSVIQLWNTMPEKGNRLFICSSLKDSLCLYCNTGYPAIAPQSETTMIKDKIIDELESRFKHIYVCYDTDNAGRKNELKMCEGTSMIPFVLPEFQGGKDISDYYKVFGKDKFKAMITNRINEIHNYSSW